MQPVIPELKALNDIVIVQPIDYEEKKVGNVIVPVSSHFKSVEGIVVSVGDGIPLKKGGKAPLGVNVGDQVIYDARAIDPVKINGVLYLFLPYQAILAIKE
jgi:co-chaperonin GroES (HSP10)